MTPSDRAVALPIGRRGQIAAAVAAAVDDVAGIRRSGGTGVEAATQHAGGRIIGVVLGESRVTVHVVAERLPLGGLVEAVRGAASAALAAAGDSRSVAVIVADLDVDRLPAVSTGRRLW